MLHRTLSRVLHLPILNSQTTPPYAIHSISSNQMNPTKKLTFSHIFQKCSNLKAINPGKQAHAQITVTGFVPTVFVSNCLLQFYCKCLNLNYAFNVFDKMPQRDVISWNTMIFGYAGVGNMEFAQFLFDSMPERDVVSWNSMLSCYLQNGFHRKSIEIFTKMRLLEIQHDYATFAVVLKACTGIEDYGLGLQVHCLAIQMGFDSDVVTGTALVDMYSTCKKLDHAFNIFCEMPERNSVCWSAVIAGYVRNDRFTEGLKLYKVMLDEGMGVSQATFASAFRSCAGLSAFELGTQLHAYALKTNFGYDNIVGTATLDMYAKCDRMVDARKVFNTFPNPTRQSHNALIVGYARQDQVLEALEIFRSLQKSYLDFDEISLSGALTACSAIKGYLEGIQLHGLAVKCGLDFNICVANTILDMYAKCGALMEACLIFDDMEIKDAVSWNAIIAAHEQNEHVEETLALFVSMLRSTMEPDDYTFGSVVKACAGKKALNYGMEVHGRVIKSGMGLDWFVGSAIIDMYCKCGMLVEAEKIHERLEERTTVSWNSIISGFSSEKQGENALSYFSRMLQVGVIPDNFTYATVLDICANLATVELGKQIHGQILKLQLHSDVYIASTIVDMYSKCGNMQDSRIMFEKAPKRDYVTWSAMICAYAYHGLGEDAIKLFEEMQLQNVKPNHTIFISVLRACAHMGFVDKGLHYFREMRSHYGLDPQMEHYSCMVDLLGRSGQVNEALELIESMPFEADDVIWRTLLGICRLQGNVEVAEKAANSLLQLDPQDSSAYVLLSNVYAIAGMWGEVAKIRSFMKNYKLKKEPGCSWIQVRDEVHAFLVGDKAHPRSEEIYQQTHLLVDEMKWDGYVPEIDGFLLDEEVDEQDSYEGHKITV
ncbi:putative tetratricopeptide-like helical domain, DYW domain-containing protein [Medicago truncatula]|uniref:PPR containing plant-like protein n=1 Tax=Medicago truncatula TaxID=3880 RepID=G7KS24_MEDTR|nr:pentatricopeptide repeat-containing protein At3g02330, mitochondrial [Medicago truncatula]AES77828.1 PPR containing plant-like protein [Medicago truncatula]KEH21778.1 PPR containing plant-like protein [Medicago truncatula]RHN44545.1 putative tetratricopeptide-like helical domain, DYW domain-containing protein [Medicago truncatula]